PSEMAPKPTAPTCLVHAGSLCPRLPSSIQSALRGANPGPNLRHKVQAFRVRTNSPDPLVAIANHYRTQDTRCQTPRWAVAVSTVRCLTPSESDTWRCARLAVRPPGAAPSWACSAI